MATKDGSEPVDHYMSMQRVHLEGFNMTLGCATRNAVTGEVDMKRMKYYPDFMIVDLFERRELPQSLNKLKQDKFLFRPVPLVNRTWLYHALFTSGFIVPGAHEENQVIRYVLGQRAVDAPTSEGLASPLMCYVPLSFGVCLMGNLFAVVVTIILFAVLRKIVMACNTPEYYKFSRLATLPFRLGHLVYLLQCLGGLEGFVQMFGFMVVIGAWVVDVLIGDFTYLVTFRLNCTYDIVTCLGNRHYICHRNGAMGQEEAFGFRGKVDEVVSGMAGWERSHILIADIADIICELRPLTDQDWQYAWEKSAESGSGLPYICTGVFEPAEWATSSPNNTGTMEQRSSTGTRSTAPDPLMIEDY